MCVAAGADDDAAAAREGPLHSRGDSFSAARAGAVGGGGGVPLAGVPLAEAGADPRDWLGRIEAAAATAQRSGGVALVW